MKEKKPTKKEGRAGKPTLQETLRRLRIADDQSGALAQELKKEVAKRKRVEEELKKRYEAFKAQSRDLEEANTALKVLLRHREEDKNDLEEKVLSNVATLILPYIDALRSTRLDREQETLLDLIESRLKKIVSPYVTRLAATNAGLTPREIQVSSLIKEGKTTKEIADLLHVSERAVEFHRGNLRKKLGLTHEKANLKSHLLSHG